MNNNIEQCLKAINNGNGLNIHGLYKTNKRRILDIIEKRLGLDDQIRTNENIILLSLDVEVNYYTNLFVLTFEQ